MALEKYDKDDVLSKESIRGFIDSQIRQAVKETLETIMEQEMRTHIGADKNERSDNRLGHRNGYRSRDLETRVGVVNLDVPRDRDGLFQTDAFEKYRRAEVSLEEAMLEMYLSGVSTRKVADVTQALCGVRKSSSAQSDLNKRLYGRLKDWRGRTIDGHYPYVYLDGIVMSMRFGEGVENVSLLIAIGISNEGYREVIGVMEGYRENKESWLEFLRLLVGRGLSGVKLMIADAHLGIKGSVKECFPDAMYQRCKIHFVRNILSKVPRRESKAVALMIKAIFAQESKEAALQKAHEIARQLNSKRLNKAAEVLETGIDQSTTFYLFPAEHWRYIASNNLIERVNREIRRRTDVVSSFPDTESCLMLVSARLRYLSDAWAKRRYMDMGLLKDMELEKEPVEVG